MNTSGNESDAEDTEINVDEIDSTDEKDTCPGPSSGGTGGMSPQCRSYHCIYCNNTFKSHYCYQVSQKVLRVQIRYQNDQKYHYYTY